jgi:exodeoxyribonuclease VII small subunit
MNEDFQNLFGDKEASDKVEKKRAKKKADETELTEERNFEEAMNELEKLVIALESGSVDLQESIEIYKKARELATWCYERLTSFQGELKTLGLDEEGEFKLDDLPPVE